MNEFEIDTDQLDLSPAAPATGNTASQKQIDLINRLKGERDLTGADIRRSLELGREQWRLGQFGTGEASALIDDLLAAPRPEAPATPAPAAEAPEGMHKLGPNIFKVQRSPQTGRLYAKRLDGKGDDWGFVYAPGAIRSLSTETVMTLDQAKEFGVLYGTCCRCGRTLTDEASIAAGIGPVCASYFEGAGA